MTELKEAVAKLDTATQDKSENYCDGVKHDPSQSGKTLIDGLTGTPTPANLLKNMKKHNEKDGKPPIPSLPGEGQPWDIEECNGNTYPWQTHHIIPKKFLPKHPVCVWLTEKYSDDPDYQLAADTKYSTDHSNNGYCLPFVSTTLQWKSAKKGRNKTDPQRLISQDEAANLMMAKTGKQLHQGNHSMQDFDEEDEIELEKYLELIEQLLDQIYGAAFDHVDVCDKCKQDGKKKVQPLDKIVRQVDFASLITKLKIDANKIFVSQRAYDFWSVNK